tara:strand:- start:1346 stop:1831 length:486 start_codon:yes stop_codon:yes gene_type:complete
MLDFLPSFSKLINNKTSIIILLFIICIFIALSIYYYKRIVQPKLNVKYIDNKEFESNSNTNHPNENDKKTATLYYFYTTWCPHCKIANPELKSLKTETKGKINNVNIIFKDIDCDHDAETADKFNVNGYPTIKLVYDNKIYDYDAKPSKDTLMQFLNSILM